MAATDRANARLSSSKTHVHSLDCVALAHEAAVEAAWDADMLISARELYGTRAQNESSVTPLLDALEEARLIHLDAVNTQHAAEDVRAAAMRRLALAHMGLSSAVAILVVEAGQPISDTLREIADRTASLRAEVGRGEIRISELERDYVKRRNRKAGGNR
jgi:hypothetical protein